MPPGESTAVRVCYLLFLEVFGMNEEMVSLDIEKVDPPVDAARDIIDPEQVRELAESIRSQGFYSPFWFVL